MKFLLRNCMQFKKKLNEGSDRVKVTEYPFFCMVLGYMLTKIQDFDFVYKTIEQALALFIQERLPQTEFFQWLILMYERPYRLHECLNFLQNVKNQPGLNICEQIDNLLKSDIYIKRPLSAQNHQNSANTENKVDMRMINETQWDEKMARQLQEQEKNNFKQQKLKMGQQQTLCEICYVDLFDGNPSFLDRCGHGFHQECLSQSFKAQINENNFPLICPNYECKAQCFQSDIKLILNDELYDRYESHTLKAYAQLNGNSVSWCPTADCGYMFFYQKDDEVKFECLECKKQYCLNCRCEWHKEMTCAQYKVSSNFSQADKQFLQFVRGKKFKQCPQCKFWVQKNQGCNHMTCKCGFQFCYKCGGVYTKCQCVQKLIQDNQRRLAQRNQGIIRKKQERLLKKLQVKKQKQEKKQKQKQEKRLLAPVKKVKIKNKSQI